MMKGMMVKRVLYAFMKKAFVLLVQCLWEGGMLPQILCPRVCSL